MAGRFKEGIETKTTLVSTGFWLLWIFVKLTAAHRMKSKVVKMKYLPSGGQKETYTLLTARRRYMKKLMYVQYKIIIYNLTLLLRLWWSLVNIESYCIYEYSFLMWTKLSLLVHFLLWKSLWNCSNGCC